MLATLRVGANFHGWRASERFGVSGESFLLEREREKQGRWENVIGRVASIFIFFLITKLLLFFLCEQKQLLNFFNEIARPRFHIQQDEENFFRFFKGVSRANRIFMNLINIIINVFFS